MSNIMRTWAFQQHGLTPTEKIVLLTLAHIADDDGVCAVAQEALADRCELPERTVRRVLTNLAEHGLIEMVGN